MGRKEGKKREGKREGKWREAKENCRKPQFLPNFSSMGAPVPIHIPNLGHIWHVSAGSWYILFHAEFYRDGHIYNHI